MFEHTCALFIPANLYYLSQTLPRSNLPMVETNNDSFFIPFFTRINKMI